MQRELRVQHSVLAQTQQLLLVATGFVLSCFPPLELLSEGSQAASAGVFLSPPSFFALFWLSSAAGNKNQQCSGGFGQCVTHSLGTKFHGRACVAAWLANTAQTPGQPFMHFHWSQIPREMRLGMVMLMIIANNARSPRILAAYQDRLPDEEMHLSVSSPFQVSARHHFLQLQRTADENMPHKKQSSSICPRLLSLISIIVLISTPQTLASQISEQLWQVLALVTVAAQEPPGFSFPAPAVLCLHGDEPRGAQGRDGGQ